MATYIMLATFTDQGIHKVSETDRRLQRNGEEVRSDREGFLLDTGRVRHGRDC